MIDTSRFLPSCPETHEGKELKRSFETTCGSGGGSSNDAITPVEPFHLDDLPFRVNAAGVGLQNQRCGWASPNLTTINNSRMISSSSIYCAISDLGVNDNNGACIPQTHHKNARFITSPLEGGNKYLLRALPGRDWRRFLDACPTESTVVRKVSTSSASSQVDAAAKSKVNVNAVEKEIVLKSTPYSLTSLRFRHGDIRLNQDLRSTPKSKRGNAAKSTDSMHHMFSGHAEGNINPDIDGADDVGLDWTAFQMAISGVVGNHWLDEDEDMIMTEASNSRMEDLEIDIDEIMRWWSETGLEAGDLVQSDLAVKKKHPTAHSHCRRWVNLRSRAKFPATVDDPPQTNCDSKIDAHNFGEHVENGPSELYLRTNDGDGSKRRKDGEGEEAHDDNFSLPPSPMQSISPSGWARVSFIPMGANIDHDLRDFLRWKNECVDSSVARENLTLG